MFIIGMIDQTKYYFFLLNNKQYPQLKDRAFCIAVIRTGDDRSLIMHIEYVHLCIIYFFIAQIGKRVYKKNTNFDN